MLLNEKTSLRHPVAKIFYFYEFYQNSYDGLKSHFGSKIEFLKPFEGTHFFDELEAAEPLKPHWVVMDDQDRKLFDNLDLKDVICAHLHHKCINLIILSHSFVSERRCYREIRNLANYYIIFDNFKFRHNIKSISKQFFGDVDFLSHVFKNLNSYIRTDGNSMYSLPLLLDLRPGVKDILRVRTPLFDKPEEVSIFSPHGQI